MIRFLDPWMLLFAAAAVVPLVVAWLARREAVAREWGAMEILARAVRHASFRRHLIDWLSVLLRSAIMLAVAFAAARPLFVPSSGGADPRPREASAGERRALVVGESNDAVVAAIEALSPPGSIVRSIPPGRLEDEPLDATVLVVLGDGVVPSPEASARLHRFVDAGGAAVVLVGPRSVETDRGAGAARFVAGLTGIGIDGAVDETAEGAAGIRLEPAGAGAARMELPGPRVRRRAVISPGRTPPGVADGDHGQPWLLAATSSGGPLAVGCRVGHGAVGIVGVPLEIEGWVKGGWTRSGESADAWTDLPAWPAVVPFVERTILAAGSMADGWNAGVSSDDAKPAGTRARLASWLARTNLAGLAIVLALAVAVVDALAAPLATVLATAGARPRSRR